VAKDTTLVDVIETYLKDCEKRVESRDKNPDARSGVSAKSGHMIKSTIDHVLAWLEREGHAGIATGRLDGRLLGTYFQDVAQEIT
jgi:hypothetical protein